MVVYGIQVIGWQAGDYPELELEIDCGAGTYIRAIARDLGALLGCGGTLSALERTASNGLYLQDSLSLDQVEHLYKQQQTIATSPQQLLAHLPSVILTHTELHRWQKGQSLPLPPPLTGANPRRSPLTEIQGMGQFPWWESVLLINIGYAPKWCCKQREQALSKVKPDIVAQQWYQRIASHQVVQPTGDHLATLANP